MVLGTIVLSFGDPPSPSCSLGLKNEARDAHDSSHVPSFVFGAPWSAFILKPSFSIIILSCHLELSCSWLTFCLKCLSSSSCFSSRTSNSWFILIEECSDDNIFVIFQLCFCFSLHIGQLKVSSHFW